MTYGQVIKNTYFQVVDTLKYIDIYVIILRSQLLFIFSVGDMKNCSTSCSSPGKCRRYPKLIPNVLSLLSLVTGCQYKKMQRTSRILQIEAFNVKISIFSLSFLVQPRVFIKNWNSRRIL